MSIEINEVAHIQFTINDPERGLPFWESLCHFMGMHTLIRSGEIESRHNVQVETVDPFDRAGELFVPIDAGRELFVVPDVQSVVDQTLDNGSYAIRIPMRVAHEGPVGLGHLSVQPG